MLPLRTEPQTDKATNQRVDDRSLINELRQALDRNYSRLLETAKKEWERSFAGNDPSDACVSVRISGNASCRLALPCAGVLRKPRGSLLKGAGRSSLA